MILSLGCIIGLFALMTLPRSYELNQIMRVGADSGSHTKPHELVIFANWPASTPKQENVSAVSHYRFDNRDLQRYRDIYDAQKKSQWAKADRLIASLNDNGLVADILAMRYLHPDYKSAYSELASWLNYHADHPDAVRIQRLAARKASTNQTPPSVKTARQFRMRYGVRDGMGGRSMPSGWHHALRLWESGNYNKAQKQFAQIAARDTLNKWQRSTAHYWAYRASIFSDLPTLAEYHLREAAMDPFTFYGAMAATQMTPSLYRPRYQRVSRDVSSHPATKRAAAFIALGRKDKAERELIHLYGKLPAAQRKELVSLAAAFRLPALQLRFSQIQHRNPEASDATAYPVPDWVPQYDMQTDPALVYAIIRQESGFNPRAKSSAGARGVMQLLPSTANYVIKSHKLNEVKLASLDMTAYSPPIRHEDLYKPDVNLLVGQHYIQYLSEKPYINGNLVYLLAAYNAGPANLLDWQKRFSNVRDPLLFIEKIPFKETRHYIKQVMANYLVYQAMMYGKAYSVPALQAGNWPSLPTRDRYASLRDRQFASRR